MARSIGARGQRNQQRAMLGRPDSLADLARCACRRWCCAAPRIAVTPVADHEAIAARIAGARLESFADCGHLSTIEQPDGGEPARDWLAATG